MTAYLIRRLIGAFGVVFGVATISFVMVFLMPGDAARMYAGPRAPEETVQRIRRQTEPLCHFPTHEASQRWTACISKQGTDTMGWSPFVSPA